MLAPPIVRADSCWSAPPLAAAAIPARERPPPLQDTATRHGVTGPSTDTAPDRDRIATAAVATAIYAPRHRPVASGTSRPPPRSPPLR